MTVTRQCPECGAALPPEHPDSPCPVCLMKLGLESWKGRSDDRLRFEFPGTEAARETFEAPAPVELSAQFPQLEILELLGLGGMGAVYKARQKSLDRLVALKIINPKVADNQDFAQRFNREAKTLARLSHQHIVAIYDFGEVDFNGDQKKLYYFIMELVDGLNLRQLLQSQKLHPREALHIVPAICDALQYAHDEGIVHRDIKPENVLIDNQGRVKIADFGLAKLIGGTAHNETLTGTHQVMGTPRYMAPEQMEGSHHVDHRADIYSLGVVLYEMLTGELPLGRFALPSQKVELDVRLDEVVLRTLEKEPLRRYQQASEVKTDLQTIEQRESNSQTAGVSEAKTGSLPDAESFRLEQLPRQFWYVSFSLLVIGWLGFAAMWNFRFLTPAVIAMAGIIWFIMCWCVKYSPALQRTWSGRTRTMHVSAFLVLLLSCVFGLILLISAYHQAMESMFWHPAAETMDSFEAKYTGREHQLIRKLDAFAESIPDVELVRQPRSFASGVTLLGTRGPHPGFFGTWHMSICTLLGFTILTCGVAAAFSARNHREIWVGSWRSFWQIGWKPALVVIGLAWCSSLFVALALLWSFLVQDGPPRLSAEGDRLGRTITVDAGVKEVSEAIEAWIERERFRTGDQWGFRFDRVPDGKKLARLDYHEAWRPSPFDRWSMTWKGPRRTSPHLVITCLASLEPVQTKVEIKAPQWPRTEEVQSWLPIVDDLESAIEEVGE